mgnify:CR=1 FL=1
MNMYCFDSKKPIYFNSIYDFERGVLLFGSHGNKKEFINKFYSTRNSILQDQNTLTSLINSLKNITNDDISNIVDGIENNFNDQVECPDYTTNYYNQGQNFIGFDSKNIVDVVNYFTDKDTTLYSTNHPFNLFDFLFQKKSF